MQFIRKHIGLRYFWLIMAFHIFNCSIDARDAKPDYIAEDLSYNEMESIVELVLENVLGVENAIAEYDEHDTDDGSSFESVKLLLYFQKILNIELVPVVLAKKRSTVLTLSYKAINLLQFYPETVTPPPWKA